MLEGAFLEMSAASQKRSASTSTSLLNEVFSFFGGASTTGKVSTANYKQSLKLSAVYDSVNQISSDVAKIPFGVFRKQGDSRLRMANHPVDFLISKEPNFYMTSFIERKMVITSLLLRGNSLQIIKTGGNGSPSELEFVNWDDLQDIRKVGDNLLYYIKGHRPHLSSEVIHIKMFTHNGIVGISPITYAAQQLNIAVEIQNFSATNFEAKGVRNGVIETDKIVKEKAGIIQGWRNAMAEKSSDRIAVLDDGFKFKPINVTPQEAQIVEMSRFSIEDIARWFNMPLHKIKSMGNSTNNNIEQQTLDYAVGTIHPYITNLEQEYTKKLFTSTEKEADYYIKGNLNVLLRADIQSKAEYYMKAIQGRWMTSNEVRALEEMNPGPELLDEFLTPVNLYTEKQLDNAIKSTSNGSE